jgi:alpha/beta superfamily hydrolase
MKPPQAVPLAVRGAAGTIETLLEDPAPDATPAAFAVVCHPHPLHGGTMHNKVVTTLARSFQELGLPTLRFNFRGVGASAGTHDEGRGETEDALAVVAAGRERWPGAALWLAGFSFGGVIALRAAERCTPPPARLVTVAPALGRLFGVAGKVPVPPCPWTLVQGDADEVIDAAEVLAIARGLVPPPEIVVMPGVGHYFHGRLGELREAVLALRAAAP